MSVIKEETIFDPSQLRESLEAFSNAVDQHYLMGSIDRYSDQWWVQFATMNKKKTMPAISRSLPDAINLALKQLAEILSVQQKEMHV